jgi:hypothetical protein
VVVESPTIRLTKENGMTKRFPMPPVLGEEIFQFLPISILEEDDSLEDFDNDNESPWGLVNESYFDSGGLKDPLELLF